MLHSNIYLRLPTYFNYLVIFTIWAAVLSFRKTDALAAVGNLSETEHSLQFKSVQIAEKSGRNLINWKGTLKEGSVISVDPDQVTGIPKAEARSRFILNKIYSLSQKDEVQ